MATSTVGIKKDVMPALATNLNDKGMEFFNRGDYGRAAEAFRAAAGAADRFKNKLFTDGMNLDEEALDDPAKAGQFSKAAVFFISAADIYTGRAVFITNEANALFLQGKAREALNACDEALKANPNSADAWELKGSIFKSMAAAADEKDDQASAIDFRNQAEECIKQAEKLKPSQP